MSWSERILTTLNLDDAWFEGRIGAGDDRRQPASDLMISRTCLWPTDGGATEGSQTGWQPSLFAPEGCRVDVEKIKTSIQERHAVSIAPFYRYVIPDAAVLGAGVVASLGASKLFAIPNSNSSLDRLNHPGVGKGAILSDGDDRWRVKASNLITLAKPSLCLAQAGSHIFGHWLVDILPRLMFHLKDCDGDELILLPADAQNLARLFNRYVGLDERRFVFYQPETDIVTSPKIVIYSSVHFSDFFHSNAAALYDHIYDRCFSDRTAASPKHASRLYFSRSRINNSDARELVNRAAVEATFRRHGFEIVHPQEHPLHEQVAMVRDATYLAGEYGSALHTCLFAPGLGKIVLASNGHGAMLEYGISALRRQPTTIIRGEQLMLKRRPPILNNFVISVSALERVLGNL
ncbi:MAG: glycosyltransferase family 61 protein [Hyphomicrobiaceae bacterium]